MNCKFLVPLFISLLLTAPQTNAAPPDPRFEAQRDAMIKMSRQLGVTCAYCHNVKNYKEPSMKTFKTAKDHMEVVTALNKKFARDSNKKLPAVDCFMCHRGVAVPDYKEKVSGF